MRLFQAAKSNGIPCSVINTPREAAAECGISLCYNPDYHNQINNLYRKGGYNALIGFYKIEKDMRGRTRISQL